MNGFRLFFRNHLNVRLKESGRIARLGATGLGPSPARSSGGRAADAETRCGGVVRRSSQQRLAHADITFSEMVPVLVFSKSGVLQQQSCPQPKLVAGDKPQVVGAKERDPMTRPAKEH